MAADAVADASLRAQMTSTLMVNTAMETVSAL
jgi:hypothetical protein